ncbi:MAG: DUF4394 domain-containing protein [Ferruginibacter sp.]|nr:DUF4394 domain-containing protein [Cytophagales bacterium]
MFTSPLKKSRFWAVALLASTTLTFNACEEIGFDPFKDKKEPVKPDVTFLALTDNNQLLKINAKNADKSLATVAVTGLASGEKLLGIDFRPATGQLYGVGSTSRLYVINAETGAARALGAAAFTPALAGTTVGLDFNPTVDRLRLVTDQGQNLRLNPETGGVMATDGSINGTGTFAVSAVAYTNNVAGAATTVLYDIDPSTDKLYRQDPPNNGTLVEVGALGVDVSGAAGFDIAPGEMTALAALTVGGKSQLYQIDLMSGKATKLGGLGYYSIIGLAIPTQAVAYAVDHANNLLIFNPEKPMPIAKAITGLQSEEAVLGLDFRPVNGQLYALGSSSRIYTINASSGAAAVVGMAPLATSLSGTDFGFDFNPVVDRIRVVSNTGQNLRLVPETAAIAGVDGALNPGMPAVTAAAYTNNFAGTTATVLYDIDTDSDKLFRQDPPNSGTLVEVGGLGLDAAAANGFDISGTKGTAYALLTSGGMTSLYTVDLMSGKATKVADFSTPVRALTVGLGF